MKKSRFGRGKHKKFNDDWEKAKEPVVEGVTFYIKYLGMCLMEKSNDEAHTAEGVKKIIHNAKYNNKVRKVSLTVTPQYIKQKDLDTEEDLQEIPIHRISYCTADKNNDKVFGFIARNMQNESLELHTYLCAKRKIAESLALTVAQAFNIAFEYWEVSKEDDNTIASLDRQFNGVIINRTELEDLPEASSPHQKSAPQAIPGSSRVTVASSPEENELIKPHCWSSGASPISPPSLQPPPCSRTRRVLTVKTQGFPPMSASAPPSVPAVPLRHRVGHLVPEPIVITGHNGHSASVDDKDESTAKLLQNWQIGKDADLDDCFSMLAESRSNPQILDTNFKNTPVDADVIIHFSPENNEKDSLLVNELEGSCESSADVLLGI